MTDPVVRLTAALADRYVIERELGAGGMATVYLAHDVRHDRKVALKVLRAELAAILGGERFLKEIRLTANLQHPHILPLHDSGEADGIVYYVMPFVEGESLRDRLAREQQLPVDDAVRIAAEVADALSYAHGQGVIHRDIKPENILLHGGHALVADFGIALAASRSDGATRMTETGMSLGTPAYMSPEQAMGSRDITPKADIYALGAVLYEMLSGEPPFVGPSAQAIIARVMTEEPRALSLHRHTIPPHVEAVTRKALEKLPADRFATAADFAEALGNPAFTTGTTAEARPVAAHARPSRRLAAMAPWAVAGLAIVAAAWMALRPRPAPPVTRYGLALPPAQEPAPYRRVIPSPDGSALLFVGTPDSAGGSNLLWLKRRDRYEATPLAGTQSVWNCVFSPDGRWIAFMSESHLEKLAVEGGSPTVLSDSAAAGRVGIAWLDDGTIVYNQVRGLGLRRVQDTGAHDSLVYRSDSLQISEPSPLPGARGVLFARCTSAICDVSDLWVLDLKSGEARRLVPGGILGVYLPTGHLLYVRDDGAAFAVPFDLGSLRIRGTPVQVLDSIGTMPGYPLLAVSPSGMLAYRTGSSAFLVGMYEMVWVDRAGRISPIDMGTDLNIDPGGGNPGWRLSPDGRRLAIGLTTGSGGDIWVKELPSGPMSRVTFDPSRELRPRWTADGRSILFVGTQGGNMELRRVTADGTGAEEVVARHPDGVYEGDVSPDGQWVVARIRGGLGRQGRDIVGWHRGDTTMVPLVASPAFDEDAFALSPDGRWIAYESDETGRREVYVRPFPNTSAGKWQASTSGGFAPVWARSGRELFFVDAARQMTVVPFTGGATPRLGERRVLFHLPQDIYLWENDYYTPFDISPDGQHFLMAREAQSGQHAAPPIIIVENWFTELRRKLRAAGQD